MNRNEFARKIFDLLLGANGNILLHKLNNLTGGVFPLFVEIKFMCLSLEIMAKRMAPFSLVENLSSRRSYRIFVFHA